MTPAVAAVLLAAVAGLVLPAPRALSLRRLHPAVSADRPPAAGTPGRPRSPAPRWLPRAVAVAAGIALLTSHAAVATLLGALAAALGVPAARARRSVERRDARLATDLPRAADLLAACLDAGAAPAQALAVVARAVRGPVGARLADLSAVLAAGGELSAGPGGPVPGPPGPVDPLERLTGALGRALGTGAPLATVLRGLAADERRRHGWAATERARAAGVRAVGPLALCFLPAFVLVGVVPVVAGVAGSVLGAVR